MSVTSVLVLGLTATVLFVAGYFLTRFADDISDGTGWGKMFVGGLLLASATSLPELMVDIESVRMNLPDLAVGDLLGSSLFNLLILVLMEWAFLRGRGMGPLPSGVIVSGVLGVVAVAIVGMAVLLPMGPSLGGVHGFLWVVLIVYIYGMTLVFREDRSLDGEPSPETPQRRGRGLGKAVAGYVVSAGVIFLIAPVFVRAADRLAVGSGWGHTFVGTSVVAMATSLPELVSTWAAFRRGSPLLAYGNILGSNAFNMILFVPLDFLFSGVLFQSVRMSHAVTAFGVVAVTAMFLIGKILRRRGSTHLPVFGAPWMVGWILGILFLLFQISRQTKAVERLF
jgi:cation:H+ antiporter